MKHSAWAFICGGFLVAAVLSGLTIFSSPIPESAWLPFVGLVLLATLSQLFATETPGRQSYYPHLVFFFAGVLLLPPALFAPLVVIPHLLEWAKERILRGPHLRAWYIQPFNVAAHLISGFAAYWVYQNFDGHPISTHMPQSILAVTVSVVVYLSFNHLLIGGALALARGLSWKESGIIEFDSLLPDFIMLYLGYIVAVLVELSPWLAIPALSPLVLTYRMFILYRIRQDNLTDVKTGLWNARHFNSIFNAEMDRAKRFNRYLTIIIADLDMQRETSDAYGRLAVDTLFSDVGKIFRRGTRQYDIPARLEDKRFAIILPETNPFEALVVAERFRTSIEEANFQVETSSTPVHITVSIGITCFPGDAVEPAQLFEAADAAVRHAQSKGGNRIVCAADVPPPTQATDTGNLQLKGDVYSPTPDKQVGFANPTVRYPWSNSN